MATGYLSPVHNDNPCNRDNQGRRNVSVILDHPIHFHITRRICHTPNEQ